jgi:rhodanese-related sulfurtransferase
MTLFNHILALGVFGLHILGANSFAKEIEYLGLFTQEEKSYIVGKGSDAIVIQRKMTSCAKNKGFFQPFVPVKGVTAVTETEMLYALNDKDAVVVDMRTEDFFLHETIPAAINIPYTEIELRMNELGCVKSCGKWECSKALKVYAFCNGPVCPQSPIAIKTMVRLGFPVEKIYYYRGGMLDWTALGLSTVEGAF